MTKAEIQILSNRELFELFKELLYNEFLTYNDQKLFGQVRSEMEYRLENWLTD